MSATITMLAKEILVCGLKQVPVLGQAVEIVDTVRQRYEAIQDRTRVEKLERDMSGFDKKMRELVQSEIHSAVVGLSSRSLQADAFSEHIRNLMDIKQNGWSPALFQGLLERSSHWKELLRNPTHYGSILADSVPLDPTKLHVFIDADKTRVLELTPVALHALLSSQQAEVVNPQMVSATDVWAFKASANAGQTFQQPASQKRKTPQQVLDAWLDYQSISQQIQEHARLRNYQKITSVLVTSLDAPVLVISKWLKSVSDPNAIGFYGLKISVTSSRTETAESKIWSKEHNTDHWVIASQKAVWVAWRQEAGYFFTAGECGGTPHDHFQSTVVAIGSLLKKSTAG